MFNSILAMLSHCHKVGVVLGLLLSQVLGFRELMGGPELWPLLLGLYKLLVPYRCIICLSTA